MTKKFIMAWLAAALFHQLSNSLRLCGAFFESWSSSGVFLSQSRREHVPKVENYFEETIPRYSLGDFKSHFRMTREQFNAACANLGNTTVSLTARFRGKLGGGWVVRRWCVNFQSRGVLLVWIQVGQGPIALVVGAGGGCLDIFSLIYRAA